MTHSLIFGTRGSALAQQQTDSVAAQLQDLFPDLDIEKIIFSTRGDRELDKPLPEIGGKGLFTAELESALRAGEIDLAVHSLKDLPTENPPGLIIGAILPRENPADALISRDSHTLDALPYGASVGTSSLRRRAQLLAHRPDLNIISLRGNVDTRLKKALDPAGPYHAIILAAAGLSRMELLDNVTEFLPFSVMLPAPGQGAVAVQCRADDAETLARLAKINCATTRCAVMAERAFLAGLGGGCSVPVGALAEVRDGILTVRGIVADADGKTVIRVEEIGAIDNPEGVGQALAQAALAQGAQSVLEQG